MTKPSEKVKEFEFHNIQNLTKWQNFQKALYDPNTKEFFGRTKKSWCQLLLFYTLFYAVLAALFALCMQGLLSTLNEKEPKWKLEESLIGTSPGLGFRPISSKTQSGSLISYNLEKPEKGQVWVNLIDAFLQPYQVPQVGENYQNCSFGLPVKEGHVCTVQIGDYGPCSSVNRYGFNSSSPCVFLKLNRIFDWEPEFYTSPEEKMPEDLKIVVEESTRKNETRVWISCEGENSFDKENLGSFRYFPSQGFAGYYFPYKNQKNYLSPLIAVQVMKVKPNTVVNIECRAWAKNIRYSGSEKNREGSVHFELLVDSSS